MNWTDLKLRLRALARHGRAERELGEELDFHQAMLSHSGRPAAAFGSADLALEECRDARGLRWLEDFGRDLRFAWRRLRRAPAFAAVAVLTLALGIGANTALFTLVRAVLLRSLAVPHPDQLVLLGNANFDGVGSGTQDGDIDGLTYNQYVRLRQQGRSFTGLAAFSAFEPTMRVDWGASSDDAVPLKLVSANYFQVLGLRPALGRFFGIEDATAAARSEAVMSYGYWRQSFGGAPGVVGHTLRIGDHTFTVIGVAPKGFAGTTVGQNPALYFPLQLQPRLITGSDWLHDPPGITRVDWLLAIGRLRPGVTLAQARAEAAVTFAATVEAQAALAPDAATGKDLLTQRLPVSSGAAGASAVRDAFGKPLLLLEVLVGLVLLIVVVNLGGMLLAQQSARQREFALRRSLGAGRGRMLRQLLTESLLLAGLGGALGWVLAQWGERLLVGLVAASDATLALPTQFDPAVLTFTAAICLAAGVALGLIPGLRLARERPAARARATHAGTGRVAVVAQVALSLVLVAGAALFLLSLTRLRSVPLGVRTADLVNCNLNADMAGATSAQAPDVYERVAAAARRLPGVEAATFSANGLFTGSDSGDAVTLQGYTVGDASAYIDSVAPGYFAALGVPLRRGREFTPADRGRLPRPLVIDEAMARRYFAGRDPLGQLATVHFTFGDQVFQIVGVSAQVLERGPRQRTQVPRVYLDAMNRGYPIGAVNFELRLAPGAALTRGELNAVVARASGMPSLRVNSLDHVQALLDATLAPDMMLVKLSACFALLVLLLAAMGLYATLSYGVVRRRAEIGIRMALGARRGAVTAMILRQALTLLAVGVALGVLVSLLLGRWLASLLFQLSPADPVSLAAATGLLLAAGVAAALAPALRASRTDPARTLRAE